MFNLFLAALGFWEFCGLGWSCVVEAMPPYFPHLLAWFRHSTYRILSTSCSGSQLTPCSGVLLPLLVSPHALLPVKDLFHHKFKGFWVTISLGHRLWARFQDRRTDRWWLQRQTVAFMLARGRLNSYRNVFNNSATCWTNTAWATHSAADQCMNCHLSVIVKPGCINSREVSSFQIWVSF